MLSFPSNSHSFRRKKEEEAERKKEEEKLQREKEEQERKEKERADNGKSFTPKFPSFWVSVDGTYAPILQITKKLGHKVSYSIGLSSPPDLFSLILSLISILAFRLVFLPD